MPVLVPQDKQQKTKRGSVPPPRPSFTGFEESLYRVAGIGAAHQKEGR